MIKEEIIQRAISLSRKGMMSKKGGPFGAVVVKQGKIVGEGCNEVTSTNDPTAHAEVVAIRNACKSLNTFLLDDCEIYCSCEPCPMCLSAIYWARIGKVYYANTKIDAAAIGFSDAFIYSEFEKKPSQRTVLAEKIEIADAKNVFEEWQQLDDKQPY